ncbi:arabinofuranosyltransferase [Lampropedia hyalina DSM 16112]|jgi:arabinofuranosyltransferase|uniref:Arabinofuranosyltransferase n=1 Tax=Lampropedia hyalina DSM 16112 TaxID=1122156 RepID=A0A1M4WFH3_9BURK|nr:hypothetical protein [Lampropedia hyalina]SHE79988.1 arabinofuranosyltransferase [Lampropedia hyalina DSM 16112]
MFSDRNDGRASKAHPEKYLLLLVALGVYLLVVLRTAWISDDAAITLRTVLNFLHGHGARFNMDERVQAYTHPVWFLLLSLCALVFKNVFVATFVLSIGVSLAAAWALLTRLNASAGAVAVAAACLILSRAFIDYSTSGLENPLSHLLVLACYLFFLRSWQQPDFRHAAMFFTGCSLLYLNRPDLLVMLAPLGTALLLRHLWAGRPFWLAVVAGGMPVVVWTLFSMYYYGFPFPNTAYAKLGAGIALDERFAQGITYLLHSLDRDPLTLFVIFCGVCIGLWQSLDRKLLALGIVLYLFYVASIGGDFMEGRFLTVPFFAALMILIQCRLTQAQTAGLLAAILGLGLLGVEQSTLRSNSDYSNGGIDANGITDERGHYYHLYGLLGFQKNFAALTEMTRHYPQSHERPATPQEVKLICGGLGFSGIREPGTHFIDICALSDPLLSRIPAQFNPHWRIGHFNRQVPTGYMQSIQANQNLLDEPAMRDFYEPIRTITRAPLNDMSRLREIWNIHTSARKQPDFHEYVHGYIPQLPASDSLHLSDLTHIVEDGTPHNAPGNHRFEHSLDVLLEQPQAFQSIDVSFDNNDRYTILVESAGRWHVVARMEPAYTAGMARHRLSVPAGTPVADRLRIVAEGGDATYVIGHLILGTNTP